MSHEPMVVPTLQFVGGIRMVGAESESHIMEKRSAVTLPSIP